MADDKDLDAANVGKDPFRPADNMVLDYDPLVDPGVEVGPVVDPNTTDGVDDSEHKAEAEAKTDDADEKTAASMSMTKAELLDRLHESASGLTKAQILEHIQRVEGADTNPNGPESPQPVAAPARVYSTETREATINGETKTWTEASEDQVPEEYRRVYARSQGRAS